MLPAAADLGDDPLMATGRHRSGSGGAPAGAPAAPAPELPLVELPEGEAEEWRRHPSDLARLVASGLLVAVVLAAVAIDPDALRNASADVVRLAGRLPAVLRSLLVGITQVMVLLVPLLLVVRAALWRRGRELGVLAVAAAVAALAMVVLKGWLDDAVPPNVITDLPDDAWVLGATFPSVPYLAALAAVVTVLASSLDRSWRRFGWACVGAAALLRLLTASQAPVNVSVTVVLGVFVGSLVLVAFGAPVRRPGAAVLRDALAGMGLDVPRLAVDPRGSTNVVVGRASDGTDVRLVVLGRDDRDADLLYRAWRALRVKGIEDESPGWSAARRAHREALVTLLAAEAGVAVPRVLGVHDGEYGDTSIAYEQLDARRLSDLPADELDDDLLRATWAEVRRLHARRLAHRELSADLVLVTGAGAPVLAGLRWGQISADDRQLGADVAELLVSTAMLVGPERAVAAAVADLDHAQLAAALPLLQPLALSDRTRKAVRKQKDLLESVRTELRAAAGLDEVELAKIQRISVARAMSTIGLLVLLLFAVGLASNWSDIVDSMQGADWAYVPWIVLLMVLTYVSGAVSLMGAVVRRLPLTDTTIVMFGQSFLNRFTPANAGGMAMRIRYLQKGGTDVAVATASVGLTSMASGVMQVVLVAIFFTWSGTSQGGFDADPGNTNVGALVILAVAVAVALVFGIAPLRRVVVPWARQLVGKVVGLLTGLGRRPDRLVELFGGAGASKLCNILAFTLSCRAFDIDLGFAQLGALYLLANTVASAVPTPGGVGAIDAALVAVLTSAGVAEAEAWSATLLFRTVTYWLPTLPGWVALKLSERRELV